MPDAYTKRLERKIHNQRVQLRLTWGIVEERMKARGHWGRPRYLQLALNKMGEILRLRNVLADIATLDYCPHCQKAANARTALDETPQTSPRRVATVKRKQTRLRAT